MNGGIISEFVFDLPVALPANLQGVPHAPIEARPTIEDVCDRLRSNPKTKDAFIERAELIEFVELANQVDLLELAGLVEQTETTDRNIRMFMQAMFDSFM